MPALAVALDLAVGDQLGHDPVEVVGLDSELLGDLGDGDAGLALHQVERLLGARIAAAAATGTSGSPGAGAPGPPASGRGTGTARTSGSPAGADQRCPRCLQPPDLLLELAQSAVNVQHRTVNKARHAEFSFRRLSGKDTNHTRTLTLTFPAIASALARIYALHVLMRLRPQRDWRFHRAFHPAE